jgi:hypothetical protein
MSNPQQPNNHAFQAGFSKAKDEYEAGYKAAIGHHPGAPIAPGQQQPGLDQQQQPGLGQQQQPGFDQQQQLGLGQQQQPGLGQQQQPGLGQQQQTGYGQQQTGYGQPQTGYGQPQLGNAGAGNMQQAGAPGMNSDVQTNAYQQHQQDLSQNPGAGGAMGGVRQQAYDEHKRHLDQNPGDAGGVGGVQQQAYNEHKDHLDRNPGAAGGASGVQQQSYDEHKDHLDRNQTTGTDRMTGGPDAGITGGNLNNQLEQEAAVHSGPAHGLGNKIKSKLPHHFNDGTKVPRELRDDGSGQNGPGPM